MCQADSGRLATGVGCATVTRAHIPSHWVAVGYGVPEVCTRHGQPAVERKKVTVVSRPPGWSYALLLARAIPFAIVATAVRKTVKAPVWPFCPECKRIRTRNLLIGLGVFVGGIALIVAGI